LFRYGFFGNNIADQIVRRSNDDHKQWFRFTELDEVCEIVAKTPLLFQPGTKFHYGLNTDILARVIELISGMTIAQFFEKEIFVPLGMVDTFFTVPIDKLHRLAEIFEVCAGQSYTLSTNRERDRSKDPVLFSGGGGLVSTLDDYSKFSCMLLNNGSYGGIQLLQPNTVQLMTSNQLLNDGDLSKMSFESSFSEVIGAGYGFGFGVSVLLDPTVGKGCALSGKGEYGWGGVAGLNFHNDPVNNVSMVFLASLIPGAAVYPIRPQFKYLAHRMLLQTD
jgi:CubicO group peptidase (beta-lactamase class C family)